MCSCGLFFLSKLVRFNLDTLQYSLILGFARQASWPPTNNKYPLATFASGCFWGVELAFQRQPGVVATAVGYVGGKKDNPTYEQVSLTQQVSPDLSSSLLFACLASHEGANLKMMSVQVCSESTGHAEAVQMTYDPQQVEYSKLVDLFYSRHNSTTPNRAGNDVGTQYRSGIYYHTEEQKQVGYSLLSVFLSAGLAYDNCLQLANL